MEAFIIVVCIIVIIAASCRLSYLAGWHNGYDTAIQLDQTNKCIGESYHTDVRDCTNCA